MPFHTPQKTKKQLTLGPAECPVESSGIQWIENRHFHQSEHWIPTILMVETTILGSLVLFPLLESNVWKQYGYLILDFNNKNNTSDWKQQPCKNSNNNNPFPNVPIFWDKPTWLESHGHNGDIVQPFRGS